MTISTHDITLIAAVCPIAVAAISDLRRFRIPDECAMLLVALYPVHMLTSSLPVFAGGGLAVAIIVLAAGITLFAFDHMGGGDVKLMSALALWAGPALIFDFLIVMALSGGVMALFMISPLRLGAALMLQRAGEGTLSANLLAEKLPYGLAIAIGGLAVLAALAGWG